MNRLASDDTSYALAAMYPDPLSDRNYAVMSADGAEKQKTIVINVVNNEPNFVHVTCEHDLHLRFRIDDSDDVSADIGGYMSGKLRNVCLIKLGYGVLIAARRGSFHELLKEF
jgi:hypothetical protein